MYPSLRQLISQLTASPRVKGILLTGSTAIALAAASDIDVIVVLDTNAERIEKLYTTVEGRFADVFFVDVWLLNQLFEQSNVSANSLDGMMTDWLLQGKIAYDQNGLLSRLKSKLERTRPAQTVSSAEQRTLWVHTNYNFIANTRYYRSSDPLYRQALDIRLLYSVMELISAYLSFRAIPWRGEKAAVKYLAHDSPEFLAIFQRLTSSNTIDGKMTYYSQLFPHIFFGAYQRWDEDFIIPMSGKNGYDSTLLKFWRDLTTRD